MRHQPTTYQDLFITVDNGRTIIPSPLHPNKAQWAALGQFFSILMLSSDDDCINKNNGVEGFQLSV